MIRYLLFLLLYKIEFLIRPFIYQRFFHITTWTFSCNCPILLLSIYKWLKKLTLKWSGDTCLIINHYRVVWLCLIILEQIWLDTIGYAYILIIKMANSHTNISTWSTMIRGVCLTFSHLLIMIAIHNILSVFRLLNHQ